MAGVHQQPELSNYLAEGQTLTCKLVNLSLSILHSLIGTSFLFPVAFFCLC